MRIIPKKIKVRSNVWKCYSMKDIFVALVVFAVVFVLITAELWIPAVILGLIALVMLMPTGDGIFYTYIFENIKFAVGKKKYMQASSHEKEKVDAITELKAIKENGILVYKNGCFGRVVKIGQKNFKIEDETQQDIDVEYFANALKMLEETQSAELVKIDRPVTLDKFSSDLFQRLNTLKAGNLPLDIKDMRMKVINERIDRIDELNNIIGELKEKIAEQERELAKVGELLLKNSEKEASNQVSLLDRNVELSDRFVGETREQVLEVIKEARAS